ncbi:MAG: PKD domain-containing protein, partial [Candidatus Methylomirabilales bacterium]
MIVFAIALSASLALAAPGDLDGDGDVDRDDLNILLLDRNRSVSESSCGTPCDLDGDGTITALDARKLVLLCTLPRCAIPPTVSVTSPEDGSVVTTSPIEVTGEVSANVVEVTVNGVPATLVNQTWTATVPLEEGSNTITAVAKDASGNEGMASLEVTLETRPESIRVPIGSGDQAMPAVDGGGNVHVVWVDDRTGNNEIFYKVVSPTGATLIDETPLTDDLGQSRRPALAIDSQGLVHIVWQDRRQRVGITQITEVFHARIDPALDDQDGSPADPEAMTIVPAHLISDDDGNFSNHPRIAVDSQGRTHVVWSDEDIGEIRYARLNSDGTVAVRTILSGGEAKFRMLPTIAIDSNDDVHLAWSDEQEQLLDAEIFYAMLDGDTGAALIEPILVTPDDGFRGRFPSIAVGPGDVVTVVFQDLRFQGTGGQTEIFMLQLDPSPDLGEVTVLSEILLTPDDGNRSNHPAAAVDAQGNVHFTYFERWNPGQRGDVRLRVVDVSGTELIPVQDLTEGRTATTTTAFTQAFLAVDGPTTVVTWTDDREGSPQVLLQIINLESDLPTNAPPVADAGPNQTVLVGMTVTLDGSGSSDADGDPVTFRWTLTVLPAGSAAAVSDPTAARPFFMADRPGIY